MSGYVITIRMVSTWVIRDRINLSDLTLRMLWFMIMVLFSFTELYFFLFIIIFRLLSRLLFPFLIHKIPRTNGSGFWIPVIQVFGSFNLLLSIVVGYRFICFFYVFSAFIKWACFVGVLALQPKLICFFSFYADVYQFPEIWKESLVAILLCLGRLSSSFETINNSHAILHFVIHICFYEWKQIS